MNKNHLKTLVLAVSALAATQVAHAITPWDVVGTTKPNATADVTVYTSGGAAQDKAYLQVVADDLAAPGTLTVFEDNNGTSTPATSTTVGTQYAGYYFIGNAALPAGLAGKKIYLEKRIYGAAGYGVVPIAAKLSIDHLNIFKTATSDWIQNEGTASTTGATAVTRLQSTTALKAGTTSSADSAKYFIQAVADGGFLGVNAEALLQIGDKVNFPGAVKEITTNALTKGWPVITAPTSLVGTTRLPTGGLVYAISVTQDLYRALQVAQSRAGSLPADTEASHIDEYANPAYIPSLSRNFLAALLSGRIADWSQVKFSDKTVTPAVTRALTDVPTINASSTAIPAPAYNTVALGLRNPGAAIGAVAYAKILNYPYAANSLPPVAATATLAAIPTGAPLVVQPGGSAATDNVLVDWQLGTNVSTFNLTTPVKLWGLAVSSGDRNTTLTTVAPIVPKLGFRNIRIDGYAGTIENVASGNYPYWAEGEVIITKVNSTPSAVTTPKFNLLTALAKSLHTPSIANKVNAKLKQPYGQAGVFGTSRTDNIATDSDVGLFSSTNPIVNLTHYDAFTKVTNLGLVPTPYKNAITSKIVLELK